MNNFTIYKSLIFEISAISSLFLINDFNGMLLYFLLHFIASLFISQIIIVLLPQIYKKNNFLNLSFFTIVNTFTLFFGYIASFYLVIVLLKKTNNHMDYKVNTINVLNIDIFPTIRREIGEASAFIASKEKNIPKTLKFKILNNFNNQINKESIQIMKNFISDTDYEIRLYSFQFLNKIKNELNSRINNSLIKLENEENLNKKAIIYKELAFYYSYMFNLNISDDFLKDFFINKSMFYIEKFEESRSDGEILFLKAQIYKLKNNLDNALLNFEKSLHYGIDEHKIYPEMAEIYFLKKDFKKIKEILMKDYSLKLDLNFSNIVNIWEDPIVYKES